MTNNNEVRDAVSPDRTLYDRARRASGREAAATLAAAAFTMAYFWAAVWLLEDSDMTILSMPVWFMASCVGGYFVSVNLVEGGAKETVALLKEAGVAMTGAGATYPYGRDPRDANIRIAPTYPPLGELQVAMELFCVCAEMTAVRRILGAK